MDDPTPHSTQAGSLADITNDPTRIRALAHPIRLALLGYLGSVPHATATECAEAIKESVASCSFHLRTLAKHGFIVRAESEDAKQRPWKAAHRDTTQTFDPSNPESLPAISALGTAVVTQVSDRLNTFLAAAPTLPERAINRSLLAQMSLWLTDDEHDQLLTNIMDLVEDYRERNIDPDKRPADALRNHYFLAATPELNAFTSPTNSDHSAEENS